MKRRSRERSSRSSSSMRRRPMIPFSPLSPPHGWAIGYERGKQSKLKTAQGQPRDGPQRPRGPQFSHKTAPRRPQDGPRTAPRRKSH